MSYVQMHGIPRGNLEPIFENRLNALETTEKEKSKEIVEINGKVNQFSKRLWFLIGLQTILFCILAITFLLYLFLFGGNNHNNNNENITNQMDKIRKQTEILELVSSRKVIFDSTERQTFSNLEKAGKCKTIAKTPGSYWLINDNNNGVGQLLERFWNQNYPLDLILCTKNILTFQLKKYDKKLEVTYNKLENTTTTTTTLLTDKFLVILRFEKFPPLYNIVSNDKKEKTSDFDYLNEKLPRPNKLEIYYIE